MKAAVFYEKHNLKIEDIEKREPTSDELLIKVKACGICGTDVHIYNGDEGAAKTPSKTVLGHEFSGIIEKVGENVSGFEVGDRVCVDPNKLCNECDFCKGGIGHFCENMIGIGTTVDGGFAEYCTIPSSQAYKLADTTTYEMAAMTEPLACCLHGIDLCQISYSDTVMIIGGGMIGLLMLQLAKLQGAAKLILVEPVEEKYSLAKKLGADICINPIKQDVLTELENLKIKRINVVIECVGKIETMKNAIEYAGQKSTVMLFGLTSPSDTLEIKPFDIFKKEITLTSSFINPYTQKRALELINSGKVDVLSPVFKTAPLEDLPTILSDENLRRQGKIIITM